MHIMQFKQWDLDCFKLIVVQLLQQIDLSLDNNSNSLFLPKNGASAAMPIWAILAVFPVLGHRCTNSIVSCACSRLPLNHKWRRLSIDVCRSRGDYTLFRCVIHICKIKHAKFARNKDEDFPVKSCHNASHKKNVLVLNQDKKVQDKPG